MEKLLHEWIKTTDINEPFVCVFAERYNLNCRDYSVCRDCRSVVIKKLVEEIERYYIPLPRFEDGEPVQEGDQTELGTVDVVRTDTSGRWQLFDEDGYEFAYGEQDDPVKRPQPKIFDRDGVAIKEGDIVWSSNGVSYTVDFIEDCDHIHLKRTFEPGIQSVTPAWNLTHKEPDSLEKLRDNVAEWVAQYRTSTPYEVVESVGEEIIDRLTALIKRGH